MTQETNSPVGSEANPSPDARTDALNAFEEIAAEALGEDEEEPAEGDEGEEPTATEEAEDEPEAEAEEDELPPIEAPVSWDAEAKERFAKLPREDQEYLAKREGERERFVQSKAQEAARVRQAVEQEAIQQLATIQRQYATQYEQVAQQFEVQEPDPSLLATDPTAYAMQAHQYRHATAQRQAAQHQAQQYAQQASAYEQQLEQQRLHQEYTTIVEQFPEYADPTTGPKIQQELSAIARELGYPPELIAEARAADILAMKKVSDLKAKADKYDALQKGKMEKVRQAKGLPKVATPGTAVSNEQTRAARADQAWARAKTGKSVNDKASGFADWASTVGLLD